MMNIKSNHSKFMAGVTLLDVLLAMVIFAVGMLALMHLQGNLARSSGDANARTVATNIAEEIIENARSFVQVGPDPNGVLNTYAAISDETRTYLRGGVNYDVTLDAQDYYFEADRVSVTTTAPDGRVAIYSDFKYLIVDVNWSTDQEFVVDEDTLAQLGTGSIRLTQLIPSSPPAAGMLVLSTGDVSGTGPVVDYSPGANPDILALTLDGANGRFKESSTPLPDVIRSDDKVETWLDVITYNQSGGIGDATFQRREEFLAVSCDCTLRIPSTGAQGGNRPAVWTGLEYEDGEFVSKPYGEPDGSQSAYCEQCCRDHHDGGTGAEETVGDDTAPRASYDPTRGKIYWDSGDLAGDHEHFGYNDSGDLVLAQSDGDYYEEACRMIRVNGWFRVAQDAALQDLNAFPEGYLDYSTGASAYSGYVIDTVSNVYDSAAFSPPFNGFPATSEANAAPIPDALGNTSQQLRARGIYVDYLTDEARLIVECMYAGGTGDDCGAPGLYSWLEVYPFFDTQLTWLARWNEENPPDIIVDVTNEPVASDNAHDRGRAVLQTGGTGYVTVVSQMHGGNLGLTASEAIDDHYVTDVERHELVMLASNDPVGPLVDGSLIVSGSITTSVRGFSAAAAVVKGNNALCSRTDVGYACLVQTAAGAGSLTVSNYYKSNKTLYACSATLTTSSQSFGVSASTTFLLPTGGESIIADIVIKEGGC